MRCGYEPVTGLYYEVARARQTVATPVLLIHGSGISGACWRTTPDGREGWADVLPERGFECWVTDWPGVGRSGLLNPLDVMFAEVVDGYEHLIRDVIGGEVLLLAHSMGGAIAWALVERHPELIRGVLSLAGMGPTVPSEPFRVLSDVDGVVVVEHPQSRVQLTIDLRAPFYPGDQYIDEQVVGAGTRFPLAGVEQFRASMVGSPPKITLQRCGMFDGLPEISKTAAFKGMKVRLVTGDSDASHTYAIESRTAELLRSWGAEVELTFLADQGITGNSHYLMLETNNMEILEVVISKLMALDSRDTP